MGSPAYPKPSIETVYPQTRVQLCMVHLMRNSLRYVSYKHMKAVATDLKAIYSASTEAVAEFNLELFAEKWDALYPSIVPRHGGHTGFASSRSLVSQKTFGIRDLHHQCHWVGQYDAAASVTRNHRIFPWDEAVYKVVSPFDAQYREEVDDADPWLESSAQSLCHRVRGAVSAMSRPPGLWNALSR
jgi:hypothetical protein